MDITGAKVTEFDSSMSGNFNVQKTVFTASGVTVTVERSLSDTNGHVLAPEFDGTLTYGITFTGA